MGFQGLLFYEDVDNATLDNLTPAADTKYFTSGNDARVPTGMNKIIMFAAVGANMTRARIEAPSLRAQGGIEILPIDDAATVTSNFFPHKQIDNPIELIEGEKLNALSTNSGAAAIEQSIAVWLCDEIPTPIVGEKIMHVDFTATTANTARAWKNAQITLGRALDAGTYAVVGMRCESASGIWSRLIFTDDKYRPMCPMFNDEADQEDPIFRNGRLGEWGRFKEDAPPLIEVFTDTTDTAIQGVLDIIKVE